MTFHGQGFITEDIIKKPVYKSDYGERYISESPVIFESYKDKIVIDFGEQNLYLENKYIPKLIKLLEQHLKEVSK